MSLWSYSILYFYFSNFWWKALVIELLKRIPILFCIILWSLRFRCPSALLRNLVQLFLQHIVQFSLLFCLLLRGAQASQVSSFSSGILFVQYIIIKEIIKCNCLLINWEL